MLLCCGYKPIKLDGSWGLEALLVPGTHVARHSVGSGICRLHRPGPSHLVPHMCLHNLPLGCVQESLETSLAKSHIAGLCVAESQFKAEACSYFSLSVSSLYEALI